MSEQNVPGVSAVTNTPEFHAAVALAVQAALSGGMLALPTAPAVPRVKSFDVNAVPTAAASNRGVYWAVCIGVGVESGIFACANEQAAYQRALAVKELYKSRGGKWKGNGKDAVWRGIPVDDRDTDAARRFLAYMDSSELANFRSSNPVVVAELLSGMDGRGRLVNRDLAEATTDDTAPGRIALAALAAAEAAAAAPIAEATGVPEPAAKEPTPTPTPNMNRPANAPSAPGQRR